MKAQVCWFIVGKYGLYFGSNWATRREAIRDHVEALGYSWADHRANGDRAVKMKVVPIRKKP